jgi:hypothetical protein
MVVEVVPLDENMGQIPIWLLVPEDLTVTI